MSRRTGDNSHGNRNELNLVEALNGKYLREINTNLKEFIRYISTNSNLELRKDTVIFSNYERDTKKKQDIYITIDGAILGVSLKMGTGNSVHQEKCNDFVDYIRDNLSATKEVCDYFKLLLWADGTLDGTGDTSLDPLTGNIKSRFTASEFKEIYPREREIMQNFLNNNERALIERFLFIGRHNSRVDYLYHGTSTQGFWISKEDVINYQIDNSKSRDLKNKSCLSVGKMSLQAWNVSKSGNTEDKRGQLQVKYPGMNKDLRYLMNLSREKIGKYEGDNQEFDLSKLLNRNKNHNFWKVLLPQYNNYDKYYLVKVDTRPKSTLSGKSVFPKADAYIINSSFQDEFLLEREYLVTESDLKDCYEYKLVEKSGISIKISESKKFTIQKFTKDSFIKAFGEYINNIEFVLFSLLLYSDQKQIYKNEKIANDLNVDLEGFKNYLINIVKLPEIDLYDSRILDKIRAHGQKLVKDAIINNIDLRESIFTGKGWFDEPYVANYLYSNGELSENDYDSDFTVTTGSGRSTGNYSIEIKPK